MDKQHDGVRREPVDFQYLAVNPLFLKWMARVGSYATEKYGSWAQYRDERLVGDKDPLNHIYEHLRQYIMGESYDHFDGDLRWHLVAVAYNAMMTFFYHSKWGHLAHPLTIAPALEALRRHAAPVNGGGSHPHPTSDEPLYKLDAIRRLVEGAADRTKFELAGDITRVLDGERFCVCGSPLRPEKNGPKGCSNVNCERYDVSA